MDINLAQPLAEMRAAFAEYEAALIANDATTLIRLFSETPETIRYGIQENLYGADEIQAFRRARPSTGLMRRLSRTVITTYDQDFAIAATLFHRDTAPGKIGRQMQSWVRHPEGWRIVAAHVSLIDETP